MKRGRPKIFRVIRWKRKWFVFEWNAYYKKYKIRDEFKKREDAEKDVEERYAKRREIIKEIHRMNGR